MTFTDYLDQKYEHDLKLKRKKRVLQKKKQQYKPTNSKKRTLVKKDEKGNKTLVVAHDRKNS